MLSKAYIINQYRNLGYSIVNTDVYGIVCAYRPDIQPQHVIVICDNRANYILTKTNTDRLKRIILDNINMPPTISDDMLFLILNNWKEPALIRKNHVHVNVFLLRQYHGHISASLKSEFDILSKILRVQKLAESKNSLQLLTFSGFYRIRATYIILVLTMLMYQYTAGKDGLWGISRDSVIKNGEYSRLISYMFAHANILHLASNLCALFFIGRLLERRSGALRLIFIYLFSGIIGGLVSITYSPVGSVFTVGASGAIYGLFGALFAKILMQNKYERDMSLSVLAVMIASSLYAGIRLLGTDNLCHIGGLIAGFLFMVFFQLCDMIEASTRSIWLQEYFNRRIVFRDGL